MSGPGMEGQGPGARGQGFHRLLAWQRAHELALAVFKLTQPLATSQSWLVRQCNRSAVPVPANIAEGFSRASSRDYLRYLNIARGSLAETEYYLLFMRDAELLSGAALTSAETLRTEAARLLVGLIRSLEAKVPSHSVPTAIRDDQSAYLVDPDEDGLRPWPLASGPPDDEHPR